MLLRSASSVEPIPVLADADTFDWQPPLRAADAGASEVSVEDFIEVDVDDLRPAVEIRRPCITRVRPPAFESDEALRGRPTPRRPPSARPLAVRSSHTDLPPMRPPMATPVLDADLPPSSTEAVARTLEREKNIRRSSYTNLGRASLDVELEMHGASLPPFRLERPAPMLPTLGGPVDELAEHLALPAGLGADEPALETLPKSILEARVAFTLLARELGLDYRLKRGIELRADVSGIEAMQSVLLEIFPDHSIRTAEDTYELRRHGALLSEILARRLDAEWLDISPSELGYWAMICPPGHAPLALWSRRSPRRDGTQGARSRELLLRAPEPHPPSVTHPA